MTEYCIKFAHVEDERVAYLCSSCLDEHAESYPAADWYRSCEIPMGKASDGAACDVCEAFVGRCWVNAYVVGTEWGGPEEGGWYYQTGHPLSSAMAETDADARQLTEIFERVHANDPRRREELRIIAQSHPAAAWPTTRPHYE